MLSDSLLEVYIIANYKHYLLVRHLSWSVLQDFVVGIGWCNSNYSEAEVNIAIASPKTDYEADEIS
jgi:hypothetical protein